MYTHRWIGGAAAIGLAGVFVLLANLAPTRADNLPGPSASQQLSQLRIDTPPPDQLPAAPPTASGTSRSNGYGAIGAGSFPRSFQIPGTSTSIRIGGTMDESLRSRLDR